MTRLPLALLASLLAAPMGAQIGPAPQGRCAFNIAFDRTVAIKLPSGQYNQYLGGNIVANCPSQRLVLKSDSLEIYGDEGRFFFIGHVDYNEPRLNLKSDFLTYFQREERLLASLNVDATLPSGSNLKGPHLEYWRAIARERQQRATAVGRPTIAVIERDSAGQPQPPVTVTGNNVWLVGDSVVASAGQVNVVRPELTATGDSLYLDGSTGLLRMMRGPRVVGTKGRPFTLVGEIIDVLSKQRKLERVLAKTKAEAVSRDMNLKSDTIDLRIAADELQRAIAWGKSRARALSASQAIVADSIDVLMPGQRLQVMYAVGSAVAEGNADTTRFRTPERDRLMGDTIVARFDTAASLVRDTTSRPKIRLLIASGHATSLQHLPPRDTTLRTPAIVYVAGRDIRVDFDSSAVQRVEVKDDSLARGIYLEPADTTKGRRSTARPGAPGAPASASGTPTSRGTPSAVPPASTPAPVPPSGSPGSVAAPPRRP